MTIRIASFLAILAIGLIAAPVETSARGGGFAGGHGMSFHGGFHAPIIRPAIARPQRVAVPARNRTAPFAHFRRTIGPRRVWVGAPWYGDYGAPWYGDYGTSSYARTGRAKPTCCQPDNGAASAFGVQRADVQGPV
jgi:hypothetical protein